MIRPLWILLLLALSACSHLLKPDVPIASQEDLAVLFAQRQPALAALQSWRANGRLAVSSTDQGGSASFDWQERSNQRHIRLNAPLGQGGAILLETPEGAMLTTTDKQQFYGDDGETLLLEAFGWPVPLADLSAWIIGLPGSVDRNDYLLDAYGRIDTLQYGPWKVDFKSYQQQDNGLELPERVFLRNGDVQVRFAVAKWHVDATG